MLQLNGLDVVLNTAFQDKPCYDRLLLRLGASAASSTSIGSSWLTLLARGESSLASENSEAEGPVQAFSLESSPPVRRRWF